MTTVQAINIKGADGPVSALKALRENDYEVKVEHRRRWKRSNDKRKLPFLATKRQAAADGYDSKDLLPKGGNTQIHIRGGVSEVNLQANARCSKEDNFNRHLGLQIALGRALADLRAIEGEGN